MAEALSFEPAEALKRLKKVGDLFAPVLTLKQKLPPQFASEEKPAPRKKLRALEKYAEKRHFNRTSEPRPGAPRRSRQGSRRRFVIQKHAASHLHYDFRLEMHDVLKSWAVPKNLSLKEGETRTAFETEDHPIDYLEFEGIIPEGEYGAGPSIIWDAGTYRNLTEVPIEQGLRQGIKIRLDGKKLKGGYALTRMSARPARWLLAKDE